MGAENIENMCLVRQNFKFDVLLYNINKYIRYANISLLDHTLRSYHFMKCLTGIKK